jgi:hypothetical protein
MYFTDGTIYKGNWSRGLQTGRSVMILPDGSVKEGFFSNNIFYGDNSPTSGSEKSFNFRSPVEKMKLMHHNYSQSSLVTVKHHQSNTELPLIDKSGHIEDFQMR